MSQNYDNPAFKKLLKKLQEESWQLELIISGFAIYGLFTAFEPLTQLLDSAQFKGQAYSSIVFTIALIFCAILLFNLLLHVLLRGLWIGTLGLRYVSGDIDYEALNYSEKFTKYLKKKVGSFDKYIATLENYCSVIFAISFLLIFYVLALTFTIITIVVIATQIIDNDYLPETFRTIVGVTLIVFIILGMILTFFDFLTQGWLKKKKWISRLYFPIYWLFSFITLSFLYRPLVYNFLDIKFGKRLIFMLLPVYFIILVIVSLEYKTSNYLDNNNNSTEIVANRGNYMDLLIEKNDFIDKVAIPSKVITSSYLNVFMIFNNNIENNVFNFNPSLKPEKDKRGLKSNVVMFDDFDFRKNDSLKIEYIKTFNSIYSIKIDTLKYVSDFILSESQRKDLGFETNISIKGLEEGKHLLNVLRKKIINGDTSSVYVARIPFWFFKD